jgi:hypothetical protein
MRLLCERPESGENGVCGVSWREKCGRLVDVDVEVLEVPFRASWRKARGGGGRLRQATKRGKKEKIRETGFLSDI